MLLAGEGSCVPSEQTPDEDPEKTSQLNPVQLDLKIDGSENLRDATLGKGAVGSNL